MMYAGYRASCALSFLSGIMFTILVTMFLRINEESSPTDLDIRRSFRTLEDDLRKSVNEVKRSLTSRLDNILNASDTYRRELTSHKTEEAYISAEIIPFPPDIPISDEKDPITEMEKVDIPAIVNKVKVLCWVMTAPKNHQKRAIHVKRTWGRRCDKLLFISSENDTTLPTTVLEDITEGRKALWAKTRRAFQLIYDEYLDEADFFLKADDDTYVVIENLRYLLKDYNSSDPYSFGCHFSFRRNKKAHNYHSGGAGYVLSKSGVRELVEKGFTSPNCKREMDGGPEDLNLGHCLEAANVTLVDTRDKHGRYRFLAYPPKVHLIPGESPKWWFHYTTKYPQKTGIDCCSDLAISFHYIQPKDMYLFEYLLYHLRPYGVHDFGGEEDSDNQTLTIERMKPTEG